MTAKDKQLNIIPDGWVETTLGEIIELIGGGTPKTIVNEYWNGNVPWLSVVDFNNGSRWVSKTEKSITEKGLVESSTKVLDTGDLIISARGTVGVLAQLKIPMAFNQSCYGIKEKKDISDKNFLYYLVKQSITQIGKNVHGAVFDTITRETFNHINIAFPPLPEQRGIAEVLSSFDDKIELLYEQNKTLEQTAQTIFKEWFGKYSPDRPEELPERWRVGKIGEEFETFLGGTPSKSKKEFWQNGNIPWVNSGAVNKFRIIEGSEFITEEALKKSATKLLPKGTVVLAITGATLGQYSRLEIEACFNQSVVGIKENKKFHSSFIYFWLANNISSVIKHASGGAHQHINKDNVNQTEIIIPENDSLKNFYKMADPIMEKISENMFQIQSLSKIRDTLLPKLMKGEIRVNSV